MKTKGVDMQTAFGTIMLRHGISHEIKVQAEDLLHGYFETVRYYRIEEDNPQASSHFYDVRANAIALETLQDALCDLIDDYHEQVEFISVRWEETIEDSGSSYVRTVSFSTVEDVFPVQIKSVDTKVKIEKTEQIFYG